MEDVLFPRESGKFIAENSTEVTIDPEGLKKCAAKIYKDLKTSGFSVSSWTQDELRPKSKDQAAIDWVFFVDSLNFSFWAENSSKPFYIQHKDKKWTGLLSLFAAVDRALEAGVPLTDPKYYATMTRDQLANVLRSETETEVPLLNERLEVLHKVGKTLLEKYDGTFANCVKQCNGSAKELLSLIVREFSPFKDEADYKGKKVSFYKRAQVLVADVWGCCEGEGLGKFHDIHEMTMLADYRVPQSLVYLGAMKYSKSLKDRLNQNTPLSNGDKLEVEIRGCSIWAVELIVKEIAELVKKEGSSMIINAVLVDQYLWKYRRAHAKEVSVVPYHKVRCIYY